MTEKIQPYLKKISFSPIDFSFTWSNIKPQSKQSTRISRGRAYTDEKKAIYVAKLVGDFRSNLTLLEPPTTYLELYALYFTKSKPPFGFKNTRPDLDNLEKPTLDALQEIIKDDCFIVLKHSVRFRSSFNCVFVFFRNVK